MIYIIWVLAGYLVIGLIFSLMFSFRKWQTGTDFLVADIWAFMVRIFIWPAAVIMYIEDRGIAQLVLIPGNREAKVFRALVSDEDTVDRDG